MNILLTEALESGKEIWNFEKWMDVLKRLNFDSYSHQEQSEFLQLIVRHLKANEEQRKLLAPIIFTRITRTALSKIETEISNE